MIKYSLILKILPPCLSTVVSEATWNNLELMYLGPPQVSSFSGGIKFILGTFPKSQRVLEEGESKKAGRDGDLDALNGVQRGQNRAGGMWQQSEKFLPLKSS